MDHEFLEDLYQEDELSHFESQLQEEIDKIFERKPMKKIHFPKIFSEKKSASKNNCSYQF